MFHSAKIVLYVNYRSSDIPEIDGLHYSLIREVTSYIICSYFPIVLYLIVSIPFEVLFQENEIQFQENEIQFQENEIQFQENEIEFQENEIQFQENEIQFQENEIQFQENEIEFQEN